MSETWELTRTYLRNWSYGRMWSSTEDYKWRAQRTDVSRKTRQMPVRYLYLEIKANILAELKRLMRELEAQL